MPMTAPDSTVPDRNRPALARLARFWPVLLILAGLVAFWLSGLGQHLTFDELARRYADIEAWRAANPLVAALAAIGVYALMVTLSIPLGWLMTLTVGVVFGWFWGTLIVLVGATIGACLLFLAASTALGDFFRKRAGGWLDRFSRGFNRDAASYLLFLRLTPVLPFSVINIAPALFGVSFFTFAWTTFVGIGPGTLVYAFVGDGLRAVVAERAAACAENVAPCGTPFDITGFVRPELFIAIGLLAVLALVPVVIRRLRGHKADRS